MTRTSAPAVSLFRLARVATIAATALSPLACIHGVRSARLTSDSAPIVRERPASSASGRTSAAPDATPAPAPVTPCEGCTSSALTPAEIATIEKRIAELRERGEPCSTYAEVMERSVRGGQISMRPYMWRVGAQLASGQARPDGAMIFAREIDSLNVGRRPFDEIVWTIEHEAAHIAFSLDSPLDRAPGDRADAYVKACRA